MDTTTIFWFVIAVTGIEIAAIFVLGHSIQSILQSDQFQSKLNVMNVLKGKPNSSEDKGISGIMFLAITMMLVVGPAIVFIDWGSQPLKWDVSMQTIITVAIFDVLLYGVLIMMSKLMTRLLHIDKSAEELVTLHKKKEKSGVDIMQLLTDAVPIEEEYKVETDHEYDGIRELDNNLPPWWKYGFYLTILIGVIYLLNYHVFKTGDLQIEAYQKEMMRADREIEQYLKDQAMNVDEYSVTTMAEAGDIAAGRNLFMQYCKVCHGEQGQGLVGPNFADQYWIYGNDIKDIFKTVKYGAKNGMKSWKDELNPIQMQQVSSFILTFEGTNPANPKEPQGDYYPPNEEQQEERDSVVIAVSE